MKHQSKQSSDEDIQRLAPNLANLAQQVLETRVVEAYKAQRLTSAEVGQILNLDRFQVDAFLKQHQAYLHYTITDFQQDVQTLGVTSPER